MSIRSIIKKLVPETMKHAISNLLIRRRERRLSRLSVQEAFDEVYRKGLWRQGDSSSGLGSEGLMAERYVELVLEYTSKHRLCTVVDAGCGDFSIGSRLAQNFDRYMAFDVSQFIIETNKRRYADFRKKNVTFDVADMTSSAFPQADLILIRQVLQHLTNAQIERVLKNLEASNWRRVLITEDVYDPRNNQLPNLDLPSHTVRTRVSLRSGVFVDKEPFNLQAKRIAIIDNVDDGRGPQAGLLVFELSRDEKAD